MRYKQVLPSHLAAIVSDLLMHPEQRGELDTLGQHGAFVTEIGKVVANFCGGAIGGVTAGPQDEVCLLVAPNDSLPSMTSNVWAGSDPQAWAQPEGAR